MAATITLPLKPNAENLSTLPKRYDKPRVSKKLGLPFPLLIFLLVCLAATLIVRFRLIFLASSDIGGIESNVIYSVQRYMAGFPLYTNPEAAPYAITQYSPFYYRIVAAFGYLADIDSDDTLGIYRVSRVISLLANIAYAFMLFKLSRQFRTSTRVSLAIATVAFILLPPQAYSRPDSIYNLLVMATLYSGLRAIRASQPREGDPWLASMVIVAGLAIATKQSGVVLPVIITGYYALYQKQWGKAIILGTSASLLGAIFLVGLMPEHDPVLLYKNIVKGVDQGIDLASFRTNIIDHYFRTFSFQNAVGLPLAIWLMRQSRSDYYWLGWAVLVIFGFSLITSLKWGSALNYFTEYIALTGLMVVIWLRQQTLTMREVGLTGRILFMSAVVWAVLPNITNFNWMRVLKTNALSEEPYYQQKQIADYLKNTLDLKPSESVFVTDYNYCYLNGLLYQNCLIPQQDMVEAVMYPRKKFNYSALDNQIRQGAIRFLITRSNETVTSFPGLTTDHYQLKHRFPNYDVYEIQ
ncbi:hypothetical protein GCM10028805_22180 [Spirosoma harenae]